MTLADAPERLRRSWLARHRPKLWLALRMTASSLVAYVLALAFALPQGYWAVLTALIVTQASVGGSLKAALDRFIGSLCGAIYGAAVALAIPHGGPLSLGLALVVAIAPLAVLAAFMASFRVAPVTAIILLLSTTAVGPLGYAMERIIEIGLGCGVGLIVSALVVPAHAHSLVLEAAGQVARLLAQLLSKLAAAAHTPAPDLGELHGQVRKALTRLETTADEAARERRSRLSDEPDPEPLYRTLRRIGHDIAALNRVLAEPLPEVVQTHLAEPWSRVANVAADMLCDLADALSRRQVPRSPEPVMKAIDAYMAAVEDMRQQGLTRGLPGDAVARILGLVFVLEQLRHNLEDLVARARESARTAARMVQSD